MRATNNLARENKAARIPAVNFLAVRYGLANGPPSRRAMLIGTVFFASEASPAKERHPVPRHGAGIQS